MTRKLSEPTLDEYGAERHPAFGYISATRSQYGGGAAVLFDSDIQHHETITIQVMPAARRREIGRDWTFGDTTPLVEVEMSLAQWASFVSSLNTAGVPCTLRRTESDHEVDALPYAPRLAESFKYTREAADRMLDEIKEKFEAVKAKPTKANIWALEIAIQNSTPNVTYATKTLVEHTENVVNRARADIEGMVLQHAQQLQLGAGEVLGLSAGAFELPAANDTEDSA